MSSTFSNLLYHIVYSTKYRKPLITSYKITLYNYICSLIRREGGKILAINGISDHIHIAVKLLPRHSISDILQLAKGNSSKWVNEQGFCSEYFSWQTGFAAFSFGKYDLNKVVRYIKNQEIHHGKKTFKEEFLELLHHYEVEYEEKYLWD